VLGLLHGDLVNVGERLGPRRSLDGLHRNFLDLLLRFIKLLLERRRLRRLPRQRIFERLTLHVKQTQARKLVMLQQAPFQELPLQRLDLRSGHFPAVRP